MTEHRIYMGPKLAQIPRGAKVKLIAKIGNKGLVEYNGERYFVPIRILWRCKDDQAD